MNYLLYVLLGITPSLIWLSFYLRKDVHPEPKKTVLKIFFLGMGAAALAAVVETLIKKGISWLPISGSFRIWVGIVYICWIVAAVEELLKYFGIEKKYMVLKDGVIKEPECDEPTDIMLYMIISALGFAALENLLIFFIKGLPLLDTLLVAGLRFIGATFLHALCSGAFGFFLALSFLNHQKRFYYFGIGLALATLLHGTFNYSIIRIEQSLAVVNNSVVIVRPHMLTLSAAILAATLLSLAVFVSWAFKRLGKIKSICKIK